MKRCLPVALCCLQGIAAALLTGLGLIFFGNLETMGINPRSIYLFGMSLACPLAMVAMFWLLSREQRLQSEELLNKKAKTPHGTSYFDLLLEQRRKLQAELEELEQLIEEEKLQLEPLHSQENLRD
jgi:hypothetical protein